MKTIENNSGDLSQEEIEALENYKKEGRPSLTKATESDILQWFQLYMSGKTYSEIAKITTSNKNVILYCSERGKWHDKKMKYYSELSDSVLKKYHDSKLETFNTVAGMISALNKYFGNKFDKYLKTNDEEIIHGLDSKLLSQYYKATETLDKLAGLNKDVKDAIPLVNINMSSGQKITQVDENTIEINNTDEHEEVSNILASLAKLKSIKDKKES